MTVTPFSDGRSTMYAIGDWAAVNNGQPYVDAAGCWWSASHEEGWSTTPDPRVDVDALPNTDGQLSANLQVQARPIILGGTVRAPDQLRLQAAIDQADALLAGPVREDTLTVAEAHLTRNVLVRREQKTQVAKVSPFTATWLLQLVADDPRRFGAPLTASAGLPSVVGGLTIPFTIPFTIASTVSTGQCSLTNPGTETGPVKRRITGPCTAPQVTHVNSGRILPFATSLTLNAGEWLDVDMEAQTVLANGQQAATRDPWVTVRGWSGFDPGDNTWAVTAASGGVGAGLIVTARPAWK